MGCGAAFCGAAPRQSGEALFLEDRGDARRAKWFAIAGQPTADVVDGEILFAQRDDPSPKSLSLARWQTLARSRDEKVTRGMTAKLMHKHAQTSGGVAEPSSRFGGGKTLHVEGPQGFLLPMGGIRRLQ